MKIITTKNAPEAIGPYSQAIVAGDYLFISGQLPFDAKTMTCVEGGIKQQTERSLLNIKEIVKEAGASIENIIKVNIYMKDMNDFSNMNEIYAKFFGNHKPARAAVEVARLPKDVMIEIECVVYLNKCKKS